VDRPLSLFASTINSDVFTAWGQQDLIPKLPKKSVVVMDNAPFHKQAEMHIALDAEWPALFYLPAYSTELNPIEKK
jgi:transposase